MSAYKIESALLTNIGAAIREKNGESTQYTPAQMATKIAAIETASAPSISVSSAGLITATAGSKSATKQLSAQAAKTVTPSTADQTAVSSGKYTTGAVTVKGDANLKAENIAEGVSIFGVAGSHTGGAEYAVCELAKTKTIATGLSRITHLYAALDTGYVSSKSYSGEGYVCNLTAAHDGFSTVTVAVSGGTVTLGYMFDGSLIAVNDPNATALG